LALAALLSTAAFGQGTTTLISGTVLDPSGAAVPGSHVTVTNAETGQAIQTVTNEKGEYVVPSVPSGTYRVAFSNTGFRSEVKEGVVVEAGVPVTVNVKLEIGQATETVVV